MSELRTIDQLETDIMKFYKREITSKISITNYVAVFSSTTSPSTYYWKDGSTYSDAITYAVLNVKTDAMFPSSSITRDGTKIVFSPVFSPVATSSWSETGLTDIEDRALANLKIFIKTNYPAGDNPEKFWYSMPDITMGSGQYAANDGLEFVVRFDLTNFDLSGTTLAESYAKMLVGQNINSNTLRPYKLNFMYIDDGQIVIQTDNTIPAEWNADDNATSASFTEDFVLDDDTFYNYIPNYVGVYGTNNHRYDQIAISIDEDTWNNTLQAGATNSLTFTYTGS